MSTVLANGPRDRVSMPGKVIPKTQKMVLDAALFNIQYHKVSFKGKVKQSRKWSSALPLHFDVVAIEKELSGHLRLWSRNLHFYYSTRIFHSSID